MIRRLFSAKTYEDANVNIGLLILRISTGFGIAFHHGFEKLPPHEDFIGMVASVGFPFPTFSAWMAMFGEFGCGLLLGLGLLTRLGSLGLMITMLGAFFTLTQMPGSSYEMPFLYLLPALVIFITGPGKFSIDSIILKK